MRSSRTLPSGLRLAIAVLVASHVALLIADPLREHLGAALAAVFAGFAALGVVWRRFESHPGPICVLVVAGILRALLVPLEPTLSDDVLRYVWDGRVVSSGSDPYRLAPDAEELAGLRDDRWEVMPHRRVATVYPPLALGTFAAAAGLPEPIVALKVLFAACDLLACWLLLRLARCEGLPPGRVALYAWNPLVVLEIAGSGHLDALVVLFQVAAVLALVRSRPARAGLAAAAGVLAKLSPLVLLPLWLRLAGPRRRAFALAAGIPLVLGALLVVGWPPAPPPGLVTYGVSWEFDGPLFEPAWRVIDRLEWVDSIKAGLDGLKARTGRHETWNPLYHWVYPQLLAKLLLGLAFVAFLVAASWRSRDPISGSGRVTGALLLCSATVYPWYLLWVLPWAALREHRAWLAASASATLAYVPQHTDLELWPLGYLAVWLPFFLLLPRSRWSSG